ncbi:trafficking protein particle complex subunit 2-like protein [Tanacetum coccineum]
MPVSYKSFIVGIISKSVLASFHLFSLTQAVHTRLMLLHDSRNDDGIKSFFQEVHELYIKASFCDLLTVFVIVSALLKRISILLNPLYLPGSRVTSSHFDTKVRALGRRCEVLLALCLSSCLSNLRIPSLYFLLSHLLLFLACHRFLSCRLLLDDSCLPSLACRLLLAVSCLMTLACIETMKFLLLALLRIKIDSDFLLLSLCRCFSFRHALLLSYLRCFLLTFLLAYFLTYFETLRLTRLLLRLLLLLLPLVVNRRLIGRLTVISSANCDLLDSLASL